MKLVLGTAAPPDYSSANAELMRDGEQRSPRPSRQDREPGWRHGFCCSVAYGREGR